MTSRSLRDKLAFAHAPSLRQPMYAVVDAVQSAPAQYQVLAPALALIALARGAGLDPIEVFRQAERMIADVDGPFSGQWQAALAYAKGELNG